MGGSINYWHGQKCGTCVRNAEDNRHGDILLSLLLVNNNPIDYDTLLSPFSRKKELVDNNNPELNGNYNIVMKYPGSS